MLSASYWSVAHYDSYAIREQLSNVNSGDPITASRNDYRRLGRRRSTDIFARSSTHYHNSTFVDLLA
jgi:hypothetical protein